MEEIDLCTFCDLMNNSELKVKILNPKAKVPSKRKEDSGYDMYGIIEEDYVAIAPGKNLIINTGIAVEFPAGLGFVVCNRGSVGTKCAIVGAHIVDSGYRGEIKIDLHNISDQYIFLSDLNSGEIGKMVREESIGFIFNSFPDRKYDLLKYVMSHEEFKIIPKSNPITQGIIIPTLDLPVRVVDELSVSQRMEGAFGSTNLKSVKE